MEWLGTAAAVVALVLGVVAGVPGVAGAVSGGVSRVVCALDAVAGGAPCAPAAVEASSRTGTIIEVTGPGGLRPEAAGGVRAKTFAAGGGGGGSALVRAVSFEDAKARFGFNDPARCRPLGPSQSGSQLCVGPDGTLRDCLVADPVLSTVSCTPRVADTTLVDQASCAAAPNALAADVASTDRLCRITRKDGSTAILRCTVDSVAGKTDGSDASENLRTCVDTGQDPYKTVDAADVSCPGKATGPFPDVRDGVEGWRFDFLCLSPGGSAYLCDTFVSSARAPKGFVPATPARPQRCSSRTIPNDTAHGDGRDLLGSCTGQQLAPGAPKAQTLTCTLPDGKTQVDCLFLDKTVQHCARTTDVCTATLATTSPNPLVNGGRTLQGPGAAGKGGAVGPVGLATLTAHALAAVLQTLQITGNAGTLPTAAGCPNPTEASASSAAADTLGTVFAEAAGVAQLVAPDGEPIATFVDGVTETDPTGPGDASAIPGHALDLLSAALGPTVAQQPGPLALIVTQADPNEPLTYDPATNTWTIGANHAGNARAFAFAADIQRLSASQPKLAEALATAATLRWPAQTRTTWGQGISALVVAGTQSHPTELQTMIADSGFPDAWLAGPLLEIVNSLGVTEARAWHLLQEVLSPSGRFMFSSGGEHLTPIQQLLYGYLANHRDPATRWKAIFQALKVQVGYELGRALGEPEDDTFPVIDRAFAPWEQGPPGGIPPIAPNPSFSGP